MSDKTISDRLTIIRRIPDAATITPQGVDRFLTSAAWAKVTRANYHGAIRARCKWLIITGRRADDPTTIATTPKVKKGRPRQSPTSTSRSCSRRGRTGGHGR